MKVIKYPKSLTDVWKWKEKVYEELKHVTDRKKYFAVTTENIVKRLGLKSIGMHDRYKRMI